MKKIEFLGHIFNQEMRQVYKALAKYTILATGGIGSIICIIQILKGHEVTAMPWQEGRRNFDRYGIYSISSNDFFTQLIVAFLSLKQSEAGGI